MVTCSGVTRRGIRCTRVVHAPHMRCTTHRRADRQSPLPTTTQRPPAHHVVTQSHSPPPPPTVVERASPTNLYAELVRYQLANPSHFDLDDDHATFDPSVVDVEPTTTVAHDHHEARMICQQQDRDYALSLRKDAAIARWRQCRRLVEALLVLRRWWRVHLCSSTIRRIQQYEAFYRSRSFAPDVSPGERERIGATIQRHKQAERWCHRWLVTPISADWDARHVIRIPALPTAASSSERSVGTTYTP